MTASPSVVSPEQAAFLEQQRSGRLATVDSRGQPHAVPICYALLDGLLYTPIDEKPKTGDPRELRRIRNILENPKVCLVVDHYEDADWSRLRWLQVRGEASLVEDHAERTRALAALRARYRQYQTMALESLPLLRITPTRLVGWSGQETGGRRQAAGGRNVNGEEPSVPNQRSARQLGSS